MEKEKKVLEIISKSHLMKKDEIVKKTNGEYDGFIDDSLMFLKDNGYIDSLPIGGSFVITQKGIRALRN